MSPRKNCQLFQVIYLRRKEVEKLFWAASDKRIKPRENSKGLPSILFYGLSIPSSYLSESNKSQTGITQLKTFSKRDERNSNFVFYFKLRVLMMNPFHNRIIRYWSFDGFIWKVVDGCASKLDKNNLSATSFAITAIQLHIMLFLPLEFGTL